MQTAGIAYNLLEYKLCFNKMIGEFEKESELNEERYLFRIFQNF